MNTRASAVSLVRISTPAEGKTRFRTFHPGETATSKQSIRLTSYLEGIHVSADVLPLRKGLAMSSAVEDGVTQCPRCTGPLASRLDANEGGGFRYDVSCPKCGEVYLEICTPVFELPAAA